MTTLLMRFAAPMQSWGTQSHFTYRDTGRDPSKSGVIGLIAAALGRPRTASLIDLDALVMGVRVNAEGAVRRDYQTVGGTHRQHDGAYGVAQVDGKVGTAQTYRSYLVDADFLVGLEATNDEQSALLHTIAHALHAPQWPLFLGRKSYVPSKPIALPLVPPLGPGLREQTVRAALLAFPWPRAATHLRCIYESLHGEQRLDRPVSFAVQDRQYLPRFVQVRQEARPVDFVALEEVDL